MATNLELYPYGRITIPLLGDVSSGDLHYNSETEGTYGNVVIVIQGDSSNGAFAGENHCCFQFDSTIAFARWQPIYWHVSMGYWANGMHNGWVSDTTTDRWFAVCTRTSQMSVCEGTPWYTTWAQFNTPQNAQYVPWTG